MSKSTGATPPAIITLPLKRCFQYYHLVQQGETMLVCDANRMLWDADLIGELLVQCSDAYRDAYYRHKPTLPDVEADWRLVRAVWRALCGAQGLAGLPPPALATHLIIREYLGTAPVEGTPEEAIPFSIRCWTCDYTKWNPTGLPLPALLDAFNQQHERRDATPPLRQ
jgi:hypothetical protein